ncbi:MAG: hypothetical protein SGJ10_06975 [Bacteroidota bacterium]|nr:hypothetical protein [Bacteroidota bacterium]
MAHSKIISHFLIIAIVFCIAAQLTGSQLRLTLVVLAVSPLFVFALTLAKRYMTDEHLIEDDTI